MAYCWSVNYSDSQGNHVYYLKATTYQSARAEFDEFLDDYRHESPNGLSYVKKPRLKWRADG